MSKSLQKVMKGASLMFAGSVIQVGIAFLGKAVIARYLPVDQYGFVSIGIVAINVGATIALFGLPDGIARYVPRYNDQRSRSVITASYILSLIVAAVMTSILYFFAGPISRLAFDDPSLEPILRAMSFGLPFWVMLDLGVGVVRGKSQALPRVYAKNILLPASRLAFVAIAILIGVGTLGVAWAYVLSYALAGIFITYTAVDSISIGGVWTNTEDISEVVSFSVPLGLKNLAGFMISNADLILLGVLRSARQVAIYNVAYPISRILTIIPGAFNFLFMPVVSDLHADQKWGEIDSVYSVTRKWMVFVTTPLFLFFILYPIPIVTTLFGAKYAEAGLALSILAVGFYVSNYTGLNSGIITSMGKSRVILGAQLITLGINTTLNLLLIPSYGVPGAAVATTISYIVREITLSGYVYKKSCIIPFSTKVFRPLIVSSSGLIILSLLVKTQFEATLWQITTIGILYIPIYSVSILRFGGIGPEDVQLLNQAETKVGVDLGPAKRVIRLFL